MDIYSFGILCLWLLFTVSLDVLKTKRQREEDMVTFANKLIDSQFNLHVSHGPNLRTLLSLTLSNDPKNRSLDFDEILSWSITAR